MWRCVLKRNNRTMQRDTYRTRREHTRQVECSTGNYRNGLTASWDGRFRIFALGERAEVLAPVVAVKFLMKMFWSTEMSMQCSTETRRPLGGACSSAMNSA